MKLTLKTEGLTGTSLEFVNKLNEKFAEMPESASIQDIELQVRAKLKGLVKEDGSPAVDFAKVAAIDFDKLADLLDEGVDGKEGKGVRSMLKKQGELINALKELGTPGDNRVKSVRDQLKDYMEKNKDKLASFRAGESNSFGTIKDDKDGGQIAGIQLDYRSAATMLLSTMDQSSGNKYATGIDIQPGLVPIARNVPFIEQYANSATTNRPRIAWTEKYNTQGNATFILEAGVKALISFQWRSFESYAKKVADKIKVSTESLDDIDWMAAEIETELKYQVDMAVDADLLSGAGDGTAGATNLKGLTAYAGGYVLTTVLTDTPNYFDVLRAGFAQIISLNFIPTHVFINPIDGANMDLTKDDNGRPMMMDYKTADGRLFRLTPVETNQIPVGSFLMGDMSRFKVRNYKPFAISYGWVNDDFEKNLVTVIGERRLHAFVASNDTGAFIYDQFADVQTAITKP